MCRLLLRGIVEVARVPPTSNALGYPWALEVGGYSYLVSDHSEVRYHVLGRSVAAT
jgi:hypothetical protein